MTTIIEELIQELTPYMITSSVAAAKPPQEQKPIHAAASPPPRPDVYTPKQKDSLLWCCYIILYGYDEYLMRSSANNGFCDEKIEINFKMKLAEQVSQKPALMKSALLNHKITKAVIEEVKSNCISGKRFEIKELIAFCIYNNKNVLIHYNNNIVMTIETGGGEAAAEWHIIHYDKTTKKYSVNVSTITAFPDSLVSPDKYYIIRQYNKPIRGFSAYKTDELNTISSILGIDHENKTKKELYELMRETILCVL